MSAPAHFGRLARLYRAMEYLSFGPFLERCRNRRLPEMLAARTALVYGDGDGRFLARLAAAAPEMMIDAVDASNTMLRHAARRLERLRAGPAARVTLRCADALAYQPQQIYDLIVSHFFLDCFTDAEIALLLQHVRAAARPGTLWIVSDFAAPKGSISGRVGRLVVRALYLAFRLLTGLRTQHLPNYASAMSATGWQLEDQHPTLRGLLVSQRWRLIDRDQGSGIRDQGSGIRDQGSAESVGEGKWVPHPTQRVGWDATQERSAASRTADSQTRRPADSQTRRPLIPDP